MLPVGQKKLQGTLRQDRVKGGVSYELITEIPKPEPWMTTGGKKFFRLFCGLFISHKMLDVGNVQEVATMAEAWDEYIRCSRDLKKEGMIITTAKGYKMQNPLLLVRDQALKRYRERATLFGMDPMSSQKIAPKKRDDRDPLDELFTKYDQE